MHASDPACPGRRRAAERAGINTDATSASRRPAIARNESQPRPPASTAAKPTPPSAAIAPKRALTRALAGARAETSGPSIAVGQYIPTDPGSAGDAIIPAGRGATMD
jgi:hypothetical protein